ncbi:MAG TPA: tetratricopeptide repeat protein, partial [Candidatus Methylomirabilis sp.]|nr:tetratricopeptide repeat protein [Candidatus Methylomirabilis sp.]
MEGALSAAQAHDRSYRDVPLFMRDLLALAAYREKQEQYAEAAQLYQKAIAAWPDDPLAPKALLAYGQSMLQNFGEPSGALKILEQAQAHPKVTPEFLRASEALIAEARQALGAEGQPSQVSPSPAAEPPVSELAAAPPAKAKVDEVPVEVAPASAPNRSLVAVPMRAVGIDGRGLQLQSGSGKLGRLPWQQVAAVCVASIGVYNASDPIAASLVLDLLMPPKSTPAGEVVHSVRLSIQDLTIPQLQAEPSPVRAFQRFVATILKATGAPPHPSRDACLGLGGFPTYPDLAAYEADLLLGLPAAE